MTDRAVPGTPRWAVVAAGAAVASVVPSSVWRIAVGLGVPLGWTEEQLRSKDIPGGGTAYVIGLSLVSVAAAFLTVRLVRPWGERVPERVPVLGGRSLPTPAVTTLAVAGAVMVLGICALSVVDWDSVSGFQRRTWSPEGLLMIACYAPALLWGPSGPRGGCS